MNAIHFLQTWSEKQQPLVPELPMGAADPGLCIQQLQYCRVRAGDGWHTIYANRSMDQSSPPHDNKKPLTNEHLSNERTLLAWIRTAVGIMAFGFVVVKFSLFIKQMEVVMGRPQVEGQHHSYSGLVGVLLVILGALALLVGMIRYHRTARQLSTGQFRERSTWLYIFAAGMLLVSIVLILYLSDIL